MKHKISFTLNGKQSDLEVEPWDTLIEVLRRDFKFRGTKEGCSVGKCGTCAVIMDRKTVNACLVLAMDADGANIITTEGLAGEAEFHPFHEAFVTQGVMRASDSAPGMKPKQEYFTFCHLCCGHCSIKATVEDGKVVDIAPDMESGFANELCPVKKSRLSIPEVLTHPDRLKYPLKRVGEKGEGKWKEISWDEALETIAKRLGELKEKHGPESLAMCLGEPKGMEYGFGQRFASAFGTPNVVTPGWSCGIPGLHAFRYTLGQSVVVDEENVPSLIVIWGLNVNHMSWGVRREMLQRCLDAGTKMVVVDPREIDLAALADMWIKIRPGGDGALAMAMLKVIIEEKLYDQDVVSNWVIGFEKLQEEIKSFSLDDAERTTWVPKQQIVDFARLYAKTKPAAIQDGNALQQNPNCFQCNRAIAILRAITGNVNIPGGDVFLTFAPFMRPGQFYLLRKLRTKEVVDKALGSEFKVAITTAFIPAISMVKSILEEKPYPIKAAWVILSDPIMSYPNATATYEAFKKLEFLVVDEIFMTPTAALADIVLPASWGMEHSELGYWPDWQQQIRAHLKLVDPPGEAWSDTKIVNEVAKRLGLKEYFWDDDEEALDEMLKPSGFTFDEFKVQKRQLLPTREYKKHDYRTPSSKIEIYSQRLADMNFLPMPTWQSVADLPEMTDRFPLMLTNYKEDLYVLTGYKMIPALRTIRPQPTVEVHPDTAKKFGIKEGEWVYIETKTGKIKQQLCFDPKLDPNVVMASFGWWFPEDGAETQYGWDRANLNVLTESENLGPECGSPYLRGIPCRVYKEENSTQTPAGTNQRKG